MPKTNASVLDPPPSESPPSEDKWLKAPDVAALAGCSPSAVRSWVARRKGPPHYRIMGHVRFRESDVLAWIEQNRIAP